MPNRQNAGKLKRIPFFADTKELSFFYNILSNGGNSLHSILTAILSEKEKPHLEKIKSVKDKKKLYDALTKKAEDFYQEDLFEKSLYTNLLAYSLFKETRLESSKDASEEEGNLIFLKNNGGFKLIVSDKKPGNFFEQKQKNSFIFFCLLRQAACFDKLNNFGEALECLKEAIGIESENCYLHFLLSKSISYSCQFSPSEIQLANNHLKKSKTLFIKNKAVSNNKGFLGKLSMEDFEVSSSDLQKYILKKKKGIDKWAKRTTNDLVKNTVKEFKGSQNNGFNRKEADEQWKEIHDILSTSNKKYIANLRFYKQNKNKGLFEKTKKDFSDFNSLKAEVYNIRRIEVNIRMLNTKTKNWLLSIWSANSEKTRFERIFETQKIKNAKELLKKKKDEKNMLNRGRENLISHRVLKELSENFYNKRRLRLKKITKGHDLTFLVLFVLLIGNFLKILTLI